MCLGDPPKQHWLIALWRLPFHATTARRRTGRTVTPQTASYGSAFNCDNLAVNASGRRQASMLPQ